MRVVSAMERLGGVADADALRRLVPWADVRRALQHGEIVRDARGRYALPTADEALRAANALSGVVSHLGAAAWWGWETKRRPEQPTVTVPRNRKVPPGRRVGVDVRWADLEDPEVTDRIVTSAARTVVDCARTLPWDEALTVADSALRHGDVTVDVLRAQASSVRGKGRAACLRVAAEASDEAADPWASVLRATALDVRRVRLDPATLADDRIGLAVEREPDPERHNALVLEGWVVLLLSWEQVMTRPDYVRACLEAVVRGRPGRVRPARGRTAASATPGP